MAKEKFLLFFFALIHTLPKKKKKKHSIATFLKCGYRSEKHGYRMIWPIAVFF